MLGASPSGSGALLPLATGCSAAEITGLEWHRVDLNRRTAWLDRTKNGTPRGVPLNEDATEVLKEQIGQHLCYRFSCIGQPLRADVTNTAWHTALKRAAVEDFRFHDLRHIWASCIARREHPAMSSRTWRLEVQNDGGPLRQVRNGGPVVCDVPD